MQPVKLWVAGPGGVYAHAITSAVRIANASLLVLGVKVPIIEEPIPTTDPPEAPLIRGATTGTAYHGLAVIDEPVDPLAPPCNDLLMRVRSMQERGRNIGLDFLVDASIASGHHSDLAREVPAKSGLPPWEVQKFDHALHLQELVSTSLIYVCAKLWSGASEPEERNV